MSNVAAQPDAPSDAELISRVRAGDQAAYGQLFERHREAAHRMARQLVRGPDIDDLISEAFTKVFVQLQRGGGPDVAFRAYLLTAIRRLHVDRARTNQRVQVTDDLEELDRGVDFVDPATSNFERGAASSAFASLPERWQLVLWHLEVEGQKPADIAPLLGMSPNSVAALAYRAREGLRQAYLQSHLADTADDSCRWTTEHLGAYVRKGLAKRDSAKVENHLEGCHRCTAVYLELTEVNSNLSGLLAPALLGLAAPGYLAATGTKLGLLLLWPVTKLKDAGAGAQAGAAAAAVAAVVAVAAVAGVFGGGGDDTKEASEPSTQQTAPDSTDSSPNNQNQSPDNDSPPDNETPPDDAPDEQPPPDEEEPPDDDTPPVEVPDTPTDVDGDIRGSNVVLRWDAVDGARGYKVYRKASPATAPTGTEAAATDIGAPAPVTTAEPVAYTVATAVSSPAASPSNGPVVSGGLIDETSFRDTSLIDGNEYRYVVTAAAHGEESRVSQPVTVTYNPVPAAPNQLRTTERASGIALRWAANSEPDIDTYRVFRDGEEIATSTTGRFTDDSAVDGSTHEYSVIAVDRSGQESPESSSVEGTFDPTPAAPSGLEVEERGTNLVLTWDKNTEPDIDQYRVYRDGDRIAMTDETSYVDRETDGGSTTYTVTATDQSGHESRESTNATIDPVPEQPTGVEADEGDRGIKVTWDRNDEPDVTGYIVKRDGKKVTETEDPRYIDTDVVDGESYTYRIVAVDAENHSDPSQPAKAVYDPVPDAPTGLDADEVDRGIKVTWDRNDEPDVTGYIVKRDGKKVTETDDPRYIDTDVVDGESYTYRIVAVDAESRSQPSQPATATYDPAPDAPTGLVAVEVEGAIELTWNANDESDLTAYLVVRDDGNTYRVTTGTSFTDRTAVDGETYSYTVIAIDASGESDASGPATSKWESPTAPTGLRADAGDQKVILSWNPNGEPDIDRYVVYRDSVLIGTTTAPTYEDQTAAEGTTYQYHVVAVDKAGNESSPSDPAPGSWEDLPPSAPTELAWELTGSDLDFSWTGTIPADFKHYEVYLDGDLLTTTTQQHASESGHYGSYTHTLRVVAVDDAGNESAATLTFTHGNADATRIRPEPSDDDSVEDDQPKPQESHRVDGFSMG